MGRRKDPSKLSSELVAALKAAASRVNTTLHDYDPGFVSATRTSNIVDKEVCNTLEEFVEIRFNRECLEIPQLSEAVRVSNGHLLICRGLLNPNVKQRKYDKALVTLIEEEDIDSEVDKILQKDNTLNLGIDEIKNRFPEVVKDLKISLERGRTLAKEVLKGCTKFKFNSVKSKINLTNEQNKKL